MSVSKWFDYNSYMNNKLAQMQKAEPDAGWTIDTLVSAFDKAGFKGEDGAAEHFAQFGQNEDVAPNAFFNATEYYRAKAAEFYGKAPGAVTDLEAANMKAAIDNAGMNAWSHYTLYGSNEGVNPSNSFDSDAYMTAKLDAMHKVAGSESMTMDQLKAAFKTAGLSALEHFMMFGGAGEGEVTNGYKGDGKIPPEFAVKLDDQVPGAISGDTFTLTAGIDNIVGTAGNDTIIAGKEGVNETLNTGDQIDGGAGIDTLKVYSGAADLGKIDMKNVEIVADYTGTGIDVTGFADVQELWLHKAGAITAKAGKNQIVGLADAAGSGITTTIDFADDGGSADAATIAVKNAGKTTAFTGITVADIENLTVDATGTNQIGTLTVAAAQNITFTGTGSVKGSVAGTTALKSVDASANTGGIDLALVAGLFTSDIKVTGGAGDDTITFGATLGTTKKAIIDLGAGDNTLSITQGTDKLATGSTINGGSGTNDTLILNTTTTAIDATTGKMFTGFEHLVLQGVSAYKVGDIAGITSYEIASTANSAASITNLGNASTVTVSESSTGTQTLTLADPSAASSSVNVVLDNGAKTADDGVDTIIDTNAHVLNVDSAGNVNATANGLDLTGATASLASVTNINITGDQAFSLTTAATTALTLIDGSAATGKLTLDASSATLGLTIKGGSADDTITGTGEADIILGGDGNDTIIGGDKADILTGGAGNDTFVYTTVGDSSSTAYDHITDFVAGADILKVGVSAAAGAFYSGSTTGTGTLLTDIATAATAALLAAGGASKAANDRFVVTITDGTDAGTYVFIDVDGSGAVNAGDLFIDVTGVTGTIGAGDFIA